MRRRASIQGIIGLKGNQIERDELNNLESTLVTIVRLDNDPRHEAQLLESHCANDGSQIRGDPAGLHVSVDVLNAAHKLRRDISGLERHLAPVDRPNPLEHAGAERSVIARDHGRLTLTQASLRPSVMFALQWENGKLNPTQAYLGANLVEEPLVNGVLSLKNHRQLSSP